MNDDFEQRLQRQRFRAMPGEWRAEILQSAREALMPHSSLHTPHVWRWWRELLWPSPQVWAGLATVWCVIGALQLSNRPQAGLSVTRLPDPSPQVRQVLQEQRRLLAELIEPEARDSAVESPPLVPGPRSQRRSAFVAV